jgi:hypothetical protein
LEGAVYEHANPPLLPGSLFGKRGITVSAFSKLHDFLAAFTDMFACAPAESGKNLCQTTNA